MKNRIIIALILFPISLILSIWILNAILKSHSTSIKNYISSNILINSNFKEGMKYWGVDKGVSLTNIDNKVYVHIVGRENQQTRFVQNIDVVSGKVYTLKFDLTGKQAGAFPIYRDTKTGKEEYIFCGGNDNAKKSYTWDIKPKRTGKNSLYMSTSQEGDYYFSNIKLIDSTYNTTTKAVLIGSIILVISIIFEAIILIFLFYFHHLNIIFTTFILLLAILPVVKISNDVKSDTENRNLAIYKPVVLDGKINTSYGKDFNDWLNDRFYLRNITIKNFSQYKMFLNNRWENDMAFSGLDKFYFLRRNINRIIRNKNIKSDDYYSTLEAFKRLKHFCQTQNIDLYVIVLPHSEEIYKEKLIGINLDNYSGCKSNTINRLIKDTDIKMLYAYDSLRRHAQDGLVYFKTDHHWSFLGGYIGYRLVINEMQKKYNDLKPKQTNDYNISLISFTPNSVGVNSVYNQLNIDEKYNHLTYPYMDKYYIYSYINNNDISDLWNHNYQNHVQTTIFNKEGYDKKVLILGDSFIWSYYMFFTHTFSETLCYINMGQIFMTQHENMIKNYKPDIMVLNIYDWNWDCIKDWYSR